MSDLKLGLNYGVKAEDYFAFNAASNSTLKAFAKCPSKWKRSKPFEATASMKHGSLVDCLLLTPECFGTEYQLSQFDSFRTKEAREWRDEMNDQGVVIVTKEECEKANLAVDRILENEEARSMALHSEKQVVIVWEQEDLKGRVTLCKGMLDMVSNQYAVLADLKTAADASPEGFSKAIANFGYAHQAAFYTDGYNAASGDAQERTGFNFVVSENTDPYEVATYCLDGDAIEYGRREYMLNLTLWNDCEETKEYPSYTDGWSKIDLPSWSYKSEEI